MTDTTSCAIVNDAIVCVGEAPMPPTGSTLTWAFVAFLFIVGGSLAIMFTRRGS